MTTLPDAIPARAPGTMPAPAPSTPATPQVVRFGVPRSVRVARVLLGACLAAAGLTLAFSLAPLMGGAPPTRFALWVRVWTFGLPGALVIASGVLTVRDITLDLARKRYRTRRGVLPFVASDFGDAGDARYIFIGAPPLLTVSAPASGEIVCEIVWDRRGLSRTRLSDTEMRWMRERRALVSPVNAPQIALRLADALEIPLLDARTDKGRAPSPPASLP